MTMYHIVDELTVDELTVDEMTVDELTCYLVHFLVTNLELSKTVPRGL